MISADDEKPRFSFYKNTDHTQGRLKMQYVHVVIDTMHNEIVMITEDSQLALTVASTDDCLSVIVKQPVIVGTNVRAS